MREGGRKGGGGGARVGGREVRVRVRVGGVKEIGRAHV